MRTHTSFDKNNKSSALIREDENMGVYSPWMSKTMYDFDISETQNDEDALEP